MSLTMQVAIFAGALGGLGIFLIIRGLVPTQPSLGAALEQLHPVISPGMATPSTQAAGPQSSFTAWMKPPLAELRLIGQTAERYVIEKVLFTLFGLLFPMILTQGLGLMGFHVRWYFPTIVSLACAMGMFLLAEVNVREKAAKAREEFRRAIATYLMLVGLVRYGGAGAVESLESAARVGDGWVFDRIRDALEDARFANEAPWTRLRQVSAEIGVPDLGDVGDIMSLVGDQGAQVYQTLLARSQSLRVVLRTKEQKRAAVATTLLYVPTTMLLMVFLVLIGFPAITRIAG